ncbi:hypothetical protein QBC38DRAFT_449355 [Podospora fimiseda]|uniref:Uncharacterized protein n=1 Tax=Podospora fimiseda TaxID=252190 RepID=A0AAN6YNE8_9PEZI|nr:hypothetical protein QBC38DRAFT_449355 [Podospora fimiseda]
MHTRAQTKKEEVAQLPQAKETPGLAGQHNTKPTVKEADLPNPHTATKHENDSLKNATKNQSAGKQPTELRKSTTSNEAGPHENRPKELSSPKESQHELLPTQKDTDDTKVGAATQMPQRGEAGPCPIPQKKPTAGSGAKPENAETKPSSNAPQTQQAVPQRKQTEAPTSSTAEPVLQKPQKKAKTSTQKAPSPKNPSNQE